ncbi:MAG: NusG domain II-containing protein [Lachnospiraceae bacterium]|nr:NusG domain II-containing protein [Lachnospiraceae bacterium]
MKRSFKLKKADIFFFAVIAVICIAVLVYRTYSQEEGAQVIVSVNGEIYGTYSLNKDQVIEINDTNVLTISDGEAYMSEASCPDQLCVSMGHISNHNELIVCLPNYVVIQVDDDSD